MEVAHYNKTENDGADAKKFYLVVTLNTASKIIGDDTVKFYN